MKNRLKRMIFAVAVAAFVVLFAFSLTGCSRRYYSQAKGGMDSDDIIVYGENSGVDLLRQKIVYTLDDFEGSADKKSELEVTYDLYNPSSETVTQSFVYAFDLGRRNGPYASIDDYVLTFEGKRVEPQLRIVYNEWFYREYQHGHDDPPEPWLSLSDDYREDDFYSPDMPVEVRTYKVDLQGESGTKNIKVKNAAYRTSARIAVENVNSADGEQTVSHDYTYFSASDGDTVKVYIMGVDEEVSLQWETSNGLYVSGQISQIATEEITFGQFVLRNYDESDGYTAVDYYNAMVDYVCDKYYGCRFIPNRIDRHLLTAIYTYDLQFPAKTIVTHTVKAPVYKATNADEFDYPVYTYKFINRLSQWNYVGELVLEIKSPYYVLDINKRFAEKRNSPGVYVAEGRMYDDIEFAIASQNEPAKDDDRDSDRGFIIYASIPLLLLFGMQFVLALYFMYGMIGAGTVIVAVLVTAAAIVIPTVLSVHVQRKRFKEAHTAALRDETEVEPEHGTVTQRGKKGEPELITETPEGEIEPEHTTATQRGKKGEPELITETPEGEIEPEHGTVTQRGKKGEPELITETPEGEIEPEHGTVTQRGKKREEDDHSEKDDRT